MTRMLLALVAGLLVLPGVYAEQYWIAYEGNALPENCGWERHYGNWQGIYHGWANRMFARSHEGESILVSESLHDTGVYDFADILRPSSIDPGPGEVFVAEWRLKVTRVIGADWYDPGISIASDDAWMVGFGFYEHQVESTFQPGVTVPITPHIFHDYRVLSYDMRTYEFYVDGTLALSGPFFDAVTRSRVAWGDFAQGVGSVAYWDYFRFGVVAEGELNPMEQAGNPTEVFGTLAGPEPVPEPAAAGLILGLLVCGGRRRVVDFGRIHR